MSLYGTSFARARKTEAAIAGLLCSRTVAQAAERAQVSRRTLERWLSQEQFRQRFEEAQRQIVPSALDVLRKASVNFASTLAGMSEDASLPPAIRLGAARDGLALILRHSGFEERLRELEVQVRTMIEGREYIP